MDNLCLSGGVALNCVSDGNLQTKKIFKKIWVQPASGDAGNSIGAALTESKAILPAAAVSGYYFAHPEARYLGVGLIQKDQLQEWAARRDLSIERAQRWLASNLLES